MSFEVRGPDDVEALVKRIREHADGKAIRREMFRGLNGVTKEVRAKMIDAIPSALPQRGGLAAEFQAATKARTTAKGGKYAGVSMRFSAKGHDVRALTRGSVRHPVYGNRNRWVTQEKGLDADQFPKAFDEQRPEVLDAMLAVLNDIARKVADG